MEINFQPEKMQKYVCNYCDFTSSNKTNYNKHLVTIKHKTAEMEINGNKNSAEKDAFKYNCNLCNYYTNKLTNYNYHMSSSKHCKNTNECCNVITNKCNHCDKEFSTLSGLWKHRKTCSIEVEVPQEAQSIIQGTKLTVGSSDIPIELILEVIKQSKEVQNVLIEQNKELQKQLLEHSNKLLENENRLLEQNDKHHKQILEIAKKPNMINSNNKTSFNLQFFLNETCKDAMNIVDFVNSLKLTNNDFETTGKLGFVNGISRIFINNLKKMDVITRPLHCTDVKRETVYIKDNDTWEKDTDEKKKLNWAVNRIAQLNLNQIQQWRQEYPDSVKNNTPDNEKFTELALVALGGRGEDEIVKFNDKIMKNVLKEVILSREPTVPSDAPSL
jgi:hypothetical protein